MKILVVSNNYPSEQTPAYGVFVYTLVQKFCEMGHEVTVVSPQLFWHRLKKGEQYGKERARVFRPAIPSFSAKKIGPYNTFHLTQWFHKMAIQRTVRKYKLEFDAVYCHFFRNAFAAVGALEHYNKPFIAAIGENLVIDLLKNWYKQRHRRN